MPALVLSTYNLSRAQHFLNSTQANQGVCCLSEEALDLMECPAKTLLSADAQAYLRLRRVHGAYAVI